MSDDTRSRPMTAETIHTCSYYCERPEYIKRQRDELRDRMESAIAQQPEIGEEIMVNAAHDVFILPLQPSGLDGSGPRFVVHVPQTEAQPAAVDEAAAIRAFEEHFQASSEDPYFERELELWLTAWRKALAAQQPEGVDEARSVSSILDGAVAFVEDLAAKLQGGAE